MDPSREKSSKSVKQFCNEIGTTLRWLEESIQWANLAEKYIGLTEEAVRKDMRYSDSSVVLWDYCAERRLRINNLTSRKLFQLQGQNPYMVTMGEEGDTSNIFVFKWFGWTYYRKGSVKFPFGQDVLGKVLDPAKNHGSEMAQ